MGWDVKGTGSTKAEALEAFAGKLTPAPKKDKPATTPHPMAAGLFGAARELLERLPEQKGDVAIRCYGHDGDDVHLVLVVTVTPRAEQGERITLTEAEVGVLTV